MKHLYEKELQKRVELETEIKKFRKKSSKANNKSLELEDDYFEVYIIVLRGRPP